MISTIEWSELVADGFCTPDEANLFASVIQRSPEGSWSFCGYHDLTDEQRQQLERVIIHICRPTIQ